MLPFALGDTLAYLIYVLRDLVALGFAALVGGWVVILAIAVLPAAIASGYQFPLLVALAGQGARASTVMLGRLCSKCGRIRPRFVDCGFGAIVGPRRCFAVALSRSGVGRNRGPRVVAGAIGAG